jgi:hypothetical protein
MATAAAAAAPMDKGPMSLQSVDVTAKPDPRALKILAKSIFKQLRTQGYEPQQILGLATEIVALVSDGLVNEPDSQR